LALVVTGEVARNVGVAALVGETVDDGRTLLDVTARAIVAGGAAVEASVGKRGDGSRQEQESGLHLARRRKVGRRG
jgi:hypothetical protein